MDSIVVGVMGIRNEFDEPRVLLVVIRVVLAPEQRGRVAFFCTEAQATAADVLELAADRAAIEQTFHDLKEVWGAGQQQLRNVYANVGRGT